MKTLEQLLTRGINGVLTAQVRAYIYDMVSAPDYNPIDLDDYCNFEANDDENRQLLIKETARACQVFKAKCMLMRVQLPPPSEIVFELNYCDNKINQEVRVKSVSQLKALHQSSDDSPTDQP